MTSRMPAAAAEAACQLELMTAAAAGTLAVPQFLIRRRLFTPTDTAVAAGDDVTGCRGYRSPV